MRRRTPLIVAVIVLTTTLGASGCAVSAPDITVGISELMQSTILAAADQAAAGDGQGALSTLDSLQGQLDRAIGSGEVSAARAGRIQDSIDLVRADLQPTPAGEPAPTETTAPVETVTPVETVPADDGVPAETGNGNNGNGNGNSGNGKDKDKDKNK